MLAAISDIIVLSTLAHGITKAEVMAMLEVISCFEMQCCILVSLAYLELRGSQ
ncbi:hypothetical protein M404DRAFT_823601 [Pisolithus tinctorius Marx 270]|uniref:Uncharacterized protein n=1 Tax=Pisolithus tinctorius Marx 270 TaxID=870435 RepID=A0A0C3ND70_PISTI|nr:hypothetical protein M404DRAFT_823601 [Pisolithus tinctorius Marx 270]